MEFLLHLEGVVKLLKLGQDDHKPHDDEEHDHQFAGVVVRVDIPVAHRAESHKDEPDGVKEMELRVDQLDTM